MNSFRQKPLVFVKNYPIFLGKLHSGSSAFSTQAGEEVFSFSIGRNNLARIGETSFEGKPHSKGGKTVKQQQPCCQKLNAQQAKAILDSCQEVVLVDVRTQPEYEKAHIPGSVLLPEQEVRQLAPGIIPNLGAKVLVYCGTGKRSAKAAAELIRMGYRDVSDFGGLDQWTYGVTDQ